MPFCLFGNCIFYYFVTYIRNRLTGLPFIFLRHNIPAAPIGSIDHVVSSLVVTVDNFIAVLYCRLLLSHSSLTSGITSLFYLSVHFLSYLWYVCYFVAEKWPYLNVQNDVIDGVPIERRYRILFFRIK